MVAFLAGTVDNVAGLSVDLHLLRTHLMLGEVFHLDAVETAQSTVHGHIGKVDATDFQALHQFTTEVQARGRCRHGTLMAGIDGLEVVHIVGRHLTLVDDKARQGSRTQGKELALKLVVRTVVEEA